jgi:hypothetical protein
VYVGEKVKGYCLLCNSRKDGIKLRTWFLCDICDRVAKSIGHHVAEQSILDFWQQRVRPKYPWLGLLQNDVPSLRPRRNTDESGVAPVDFLAVDERRKRKVFGIQNKTGRSSIQEMSQFQLDTSDCDCILNDMRALKIPMYVIHAQVLELWEPPSGGQDWPPGTSVAAGRKSPARGPDTAFFLPGVPGCLAPVPPSGIHQPLGQT